VGEAVVMVLQLLVLPRPRIGRGDLVVLKFKEGEALLALGGGVAQVFQAVAQGGTTSVLAGALVGEVGGVGEGVEEAALIGRLEEPLVLELPVGLEEQVA
jgi:hypothetical protein